MTGRLQLIEQKLVALDSAAFQNLCDLYLALRDREFLSFNRGGSQLGKQKTTKGTPDTYYRLQSGALRYVEYTTKQDDIVNKIKGDIDSCLNPIKTGVPANEVTNIIICFNSRLKPKDERAIQKHARSKRVQVTLIGLDLLALDIFSKYLHLAQDPLGIPLTTGQIQPLSQFVEEYGSKAGNLSTPLDNTFLFRDEEKARIGQAFAEHNLIILSGFPGVGKTKLALEVIDEFVKENDSYTPYAISMKGVDIWEDMRVQLQNDGNYILLVDDANRQMVNFQQILGVYKELKNGNIKLLVTVRDYALPDIRNICAELKQHEEHIEKFSDDQVTELIKGAPFNILDTEFHKRIIEIADGNPRLAIMAAKTANEQQGKFLIEDVSGLYDYYFQTFIKDYNIFEDKVMLATLGIISFFYTIDRSNKEFILELLASFEIDYHQFNEAINELANRELVEIQYDHVKIAEQVMATYFFYKVFIKDEILPFKTLLYNYFPKWRKRFTDTIIPANNSFKYENVFKKVNSDLDEFLVNIKGDEEQVLEFFSAFWFYKREDVLAYYHDKIKQLQEPEQPVYDASYETNDFVYGHDKTLDFLSDLLLHPTESYLPALEVAFEYCRKKPGGLPEFVRRIREKVVFGLRDQTWGFSRQIDLFDHLIENHRKRHPHYVEAFFHLATTFLDHYFHITEGVRGNKISMYDYPFPLAPSTKEFRRTIWEALLDSYDDYPDEVLRLLENYRPSRNKCQPDVLEFDLTLILPFIEEKLSINNFRHIKFVQEFVAWLDEESVKDRSYQKLTSDFSSLDFEHYKKLDWDRFQFRKEYGDDNIRDWDALKEQDIRAHFVFKTPEDFTSLHRTLAHVIELDAANLWSISKSLDIIVAENFRLNNELGFELLSSLLRNYPKGFDILSNSLKVIIEESDFWAKRLWDLLNSNLDNTSLFWKLNFFFHLPEEYCTLYYREQLLLTIKSINQGCGLFFESFDKFIPIVPQPKNKLVAYLSRIPLIGKLIFPEPRNIIEEMVEITAHKIDQENIRVIYFHHFFEQYSSMLSHNFPLLAKAYLQQERLEQYFDHDRKGLQALVQLEPRFFIDYVRTFYASDEWENWHTHNRLSFIWDMSEMDSIIQEAADLIIDHHAFFGILEHPLNILFQRINEDNKERAFTFLKKYISDNHTDTQRINAVVDVLRHTMKEYFEQGLIHYLMLNQDVNQFDKIWWRGNGGTYTGNVNIGEIHAKDWQDILSMTDKCENQMDIIPIRNYIKKQINNELQNAKRERERKYTDPDH